MVFLMIYDENEKKREYWIQIKTPKQLGEGDGDVCSIFGLVYKERG